MFKFLIHLIYVLPFICLSQVGVGTTSPESTLDVRATNHLGAVTETDGILVPRVNNLAVNGSVNGQLVYLIADQGSYLKGFHYWDGSAWQPFSNSKDYGRFADLASLNAVASVPVVGSSAILTDATGLTNWDGSAITTDNVMFYFVTYLNYGGTTEWRVSSHFVVGDSSLNCSLGNFSAPITDGTSVTDTQTGSSLTTQINTVGTVLSSLDNGVQINSPNNGEYEWLFNSSIDNVIFSSTYFGDTGVELNELEFYDENGNLIMDADTYAMASNIDYSVTNASGVITVTNTMVLANTEGVDFNFGSQQISRIVVRGDGANAPSIVWKIENHCKVETNIALAEDVLVVDCSTSPGQANFNNGVIAFGLTSQSTSLGDVRVRQQGDLSNYAWVSGDGWLKSSDWIGFYNGTTTVFPFKNNYTIPGMIFDYQSNDLIATGQTKWTGTATSGTYEDGSSNGGRPLYSINGNTGVDAGGFYAMETANHYVVHLEGRYGVKYDIDGDGTFETPGHRLMWFDKNWQLDTSIRNETGYTDTVGLYYVGGWESGGNIYSREGVSNAVSIYSGTDGSSVGTLTIPAPANVSNTEIQHIHHGEDGRTYIVLNNTYLISHDAGQTSGNFRVHASVDTASTVVVKSNGDIIAGTRDDGIYWVNDSPGGTTLNNTNVNNRGIIKLTQSGGYTFNDAAFKTNFHAATINDSADYATIVHPHPDGFIFTNNGSSDTIFVEEDRDNNYATTTTIDNYGKTVIVDMEGNYIRRFPYLLISTATQSFLRGDIQAYMNFSGRANVYHFNINNYNDDSILYAINPSLVADLPAGAPYDLRFSCFTIDGFPLDTVLLVNSDGEPCD